jgi:ABC-type phosphate/phosphonate transport system substrate-binding protein
MKSLILPIIFAFTLTARAADFVIALKPDKNPDQMLTERKALAGELSKALGKTVEVIVPLSSAVLIEGLANGSIDAGYLSATDLVHARKAGAANLLLAGEINGRREYSSYWVALRDKPLKSSLPPEWPFPLPIS